MPLVETLPVGVDTAQWTVWGTTARIGMTDALWYFGRGSGVVSLVLLTVAVALGVGARSGRTPFGLPRFAVSMVHRNAALIAVVFLAGHVLALLVDPYAQLRLLDLVLPFAGNYRPLWQGLGTVALDLMAAIVVTSLLRHRLGARVWRAVHWLTYLCWPMALPHGLGTGSDRALAHRARRPSCFRRTPAR